MMHATRRDISLGFSDGRVPEGQHICYIFHDDAERRRVMSKFLESGLRDGERVLYLVDVMTPAELRDWLLEVGVDVRSKGPALTIAEAASGYCPSGHFHADEMLATIRGFYRQAVADGFAGARGTGEMSWCLSEGRADKGALMDYEARLNLVVAEHPLTACCQYDARRFDGQTIMDVLSVHPVMIVRGQLMQNPCYVEPAVFLQEYRARNQPQ